MTHYLKIGKSFSVVALLKLNESANNSFEVILNSFILQDKSSICVGKLLNTLIP